jgi:hypothetical protein
MGHRVNPTRLSPGERFRHEIEKAVEAGADVDDMTLRMTLGDANKLRRDPTLALADISFGGGVMRYLGVKVEQGGVDTSILVTPT